MKKSISVLLALIVLVTTLSTNSYASTTSRNGFNYDSAYNVKWIEKKTVIGESFVGGKLGAMSYVLGVGLKKILENVVFLQRKRWHQIRKRLKWREV